MPTLKVRHVTGEMLDAKYSANPDLCPLCHHAVEAVPIGFGVMVGNVPGMDGTVLELVFRCPRYDCGSIFIGRYEQEPGIRKHERYGDFLPAALVPGNFRKPGHKKEIQEISPNFVTVFNQATEAEHHQLTEIAGVGYRKALEFLVKDYCIRRKPEDQAAIRKELLGTTINNRIDDTRLKECARRATWLGNDETHYERRWEDRDIGDLKTLIGLTVNWVQNDIVTERYIREMDQGRK